MSALSARLEYVEVYIEKIGEDSLRNALTIDVEDWYQTQDFNIPVADWPLYEDRIIKSMDKILELLTKYQVQATFFVLGCVAARHPELVKQIKNRGHEIGSHGYWHKMVNEQTKEEFRRNVVQSKEILVKITGESVKLYRAPSWSISLDSLWALEILEEEGFVCDSSIQPYKTPLSGIRGAPIVPFHPAAGGSSLKLIEFPPTVLSLAGFKMPFAGGLYLRTLPYRILSEAMRRVNKTRAAMIYLHPWETDIEQPRICRPKHIEFIHYYNLETTLRKLERLLNDYKFVPLGELIRDEEYPVLSIKT